MSITFTSGLSKPSGVLDKPGSIERPAFDTLYGFDAPQGLLPPIFNITEEAAENDIITTSPPNPSGEVNIRYAEDTDYLYVYDGTDWYKFIND